MSVSIQLKQSQSFCSNYYCGTSLLTSYLISQFTWFRMKVMCPKSATLTNFGFDAIVIILKHWWLIQNKCNLKLLMASLSPWDEPLLKLVKISPFYHWAAKVGKPRRGSAVGRVVDSRLERSCCNQWFVDLSSLRHEANVWSFNSSGKHCRKASRAL